MDSFVDSFIEKHRLPESFRQVAAHYLPLCDEVKFWTDEKNAHSDEPLVLGINGSQASGKSTLADFIAEVLEHTKNLEVAVFSIDDFYMTRAQRQALAKSVHPLLSTRGVPGTHDMDLAFTTLQSLLGGKSSVPLPRFDKSMDDRAPEDTWPYSKSKVDLIILEGWCVGSIAQPSESLMAPVNDLERLEDPDCAWRKYANDMLAGDYQKLFGLIDHLIMLKVPSFECVLRWRVKQEKKLIDKVGTEAEGIMNEEQIARFIQHYERITEFNLSVLPSRCRKVFFLKSDHTLS